MLQDPVVGLNMVSDLERRVNRAIDIAEATKTTNDAIDRAGEVSEKEERRETRELLRAINECGACQSARRQVGYPGMPSSHRYCEQHR